MAGTEYGTVDILSVFFRLKNYQNFLPNTESTRIGLNASSEEMSIGNRSTRSASKSLTATIKKL